MKRNLFQWLLLPVLGGLLACSQPTLPVEEENTHENNEPGTLPDATPPHENLPWEDVDGKFAFNNDGSIRLAAPAGNAGEAILLVRQSQLRRTCWEFRLQLSFNPSENNYMRIYLASSEADVHAPLDGYFLQIGGKQDDIALYRQEGEDTTLLLRTPELMQGDSSPELKLTVSYDNLGYFSLTAVNLEQPPRTFSGTVKDGHFDHTAYCIVQCVYTKSRTRGFLLQSSRLHHNVPDREILYPESAG